MATAAKVALKAGARLSERVETMDNRELVTAFGVATDKLAMRRGWARGADHSSPGGNQAEALAMLAHMLDGREVKISVRDLTEARLGHEKLVEAEEG